MENHLLAYSNQTDDSSNNRQTINQKISKLEKHTRIFASMCPDEILDYFDDYSMREYLTTLMLGDISGFTDFVEKYTKAGKGGASNLTETLNNYIGLMIQEILSQNGDVLKFSGDSFIVMWKLKNDTNMRDLATTAIQTACVIQQHFGIYETDVGITLRVKIAIASGTTYFTSIGDPKKMSHYMITGRPVWEVKYAEQLCKGGDILVALSTWQWINPIDYVYETLPDGLHVLVITCSTLWYTLKSSYNEKPNNEEEYVGQSNVSKKYENDLLYLLMNFVLFLFFLFFFSVRPKILKVAKAHLKDALKSYILRPVVRSVEMDEPLKYLSEMRQVVIVFVNATINEIKNKQLIRSIDAAYKLVCRIVSGMQGCVNKTSLFDKDLMFLCIFGLRGDKHELESQIGLKCGFRLRIALKELTNITDVTVGVTTGMTYCGVVGYILRREYTVIGMAVNRAARLMMVYKNKVICDRESFLHSQLEGSHFKLQEPKYLKGIIDIGPIYEFEEQVKDKTSELIWSKYPLLGRAKEMKIFRNLLATMLDYTVMKNHSTTEPQYNTLIIKGEPRIGKTRMLDEMALNIPNGIPSNYISLVSTDMQVVDHEIFFCKPYTLFHLIFSLPLKFSSTSTSKDREDKLMRLLNNILYPEYLCVLNKVFNVRFPLTEEYTTVKELEKHRILEKLLIYLTKKCFQKLWIIIIDDIEYADEESLNFFDILINTNMFLFVISVGRKVDAEYKLANTLLKRALVIELQGIDKWYHVGIVCQILNVFGISTELEKFIQERSLGNPGWIESYLVSLMQSNNLEIINVTRKEAESMGYVLPDLKMLKRFILDSTILKKSSLPREDRWEMYETSYMNDTMFSINNTIHQDEIDLNSELISIAFSKTLENSLIMNINMRINFDVLILKVFDALTPLDQLLLKCASILGVFVCRKMLESITEMSKKDTGLTIRKLFEIRIFECGMGDFTKNVGPIMYYRRMRNHIGDIGIQCRCIGIVIPEELANMPKYASCGLIRFKITIFQDTTYRLLTENQKIELHKKALKYLERNTRRCKSCGEGYFSKLLGEKFLDEVGKIPIEYSLNIRQFHGISSKLFDIPKIKNVLTNKKSPPYLNILRKSKKKLIRTFSNIDFTNCECNLILLTVYTQMVEHCRRIGDNDKTLIAILEFAEICIENQNVPQARKLLNEAETILQQIFDPNKNEVITFLYLTAKIQTLQGKCYFESGYTSEAEKSLDKAMKTLGYHFPRTNIMINLKTIFQLNKLKLLLLFCSRKRKSDNDKNNYATKYTNQLAYCLAQIFEVYKIKGMKKETRLAAIWALNKARSTSDFLVLSICYTNMLTIGHMYCTNNIIKYLENESIDLCNEEVRIIEYQDLKIIIELYAGVFFSRWLRGQINEAIDIGFIIIRLAKSINLTNTECIVLPRLINLLMISCRYSEIVSILRDLEFVSKNHMDKSGRTWYYATCAEVQLDIGLIVLSYQNCERYFLKEGENLLSLRDSEAERRYFISMWLWCIRNKEWAASKVWIKKKVERKSTDEDLVAATITDLKELEGMLISYVHYVNNYDAKAINIMTSIKASLKNIKKMVKIVKIARPRYILIKAYYYMVRGYKKMAIKILQKAIKISFKMDNKMIYGWAMHCKQAWEGKLPLIERDLWQQQSMIPSSSTWNEINTNETKIIFYTLPIPTY
ncbi:adenylate cyclase type 10-like [Vespa mandarinia]|uniref:adenylate cyclase type 10-like n=1 Tax=Vespa mandarinia TaxID=7446 RepID=UPI001609DFF2|nr:adenylate cyclase type 10-like [Vespa mandarinia]